MGRLPAGTTRGPCEIIAAIGEGGMGEVYRARDTRLDRQVAVKVLARNLASNEEALARFRHEVRAIAALSDPNIIAIYDVGREGDLVYGVTELSSPERPSATACGGSNCFRGGSPCRLRSRSAAAGIGRARC